MTSHFTPAQHSTDYQNWICPQLSGHWKLAKVRNSDQILLRSPTTQTQFQFSAAEGFALQHFIGTFTVREIQQRCQEKFADQISPTLIEDLLQKLLDWKILELPQEPLLFNPSYCANWICPDLMAYWKLSPTPDAERIVFTAIEGNLQVLFSATEGYALQHFTGKLTVSQIEDLCQQRFGSKITRNFVGNLLQKLIELKILELSPESRETLEPKNVPASHYNQLPQLKSCVHWIAHPDGYWILRNPEDVTFLQMSDRDQAIIEQISQSSVNAIARQFSCSPQEVRSLLQLLAATGMLVGTQPVQARRGKFTPFQLLSFKVSLLNPDDWLSQNIDNIRWIWSASFSYGLVFFLGFAGVVGYGQTAEILAFGQQLWMSEGSRLMVPLALLSMFVVSIHELGHAFTLKHYNGIVPEIGLLFMCLIPTAYTNTTDSYCLPRSQRIQVVGAGVIVQVTIAAIALILWNIAVLGTWLHTLSYLLMTAALFTLAINLNPLAKFDGYYLAVAVSGINNLRSRAFKFYGNLLTGKPIQETGRDRVYLAAYAPFSLAYIYFVFGFLLFRITDWSLTNIPITAIVLLGIWAIYFFFPDKK